MPVPQPAAPDAREGEAFGMVLGQVVVRLREQLRLTQVALAERVGVSQSAISKIEAGRRPDAFLYGQLARALGLDVHTLDAQVHESMKRTREAVAAVTKKKASSNWGELLALAGFVGIITFVVAAVIGDDDEDEPDAKPTKK